MFGWNETIAKLAKEEALAEAEKSQNVVASAKKPIVIEEVEDYIKSEIRVALIDCFRLAEKNGYTDKEWVMGIAVKAIEEYKKGF